MRLDVPYDTIVFQTTYQCAMPRLVRLAWYA